MPRPFLASLLSLVAPVLSLAGSPELELPLAPEADRSLWVALDAGPGFGSTVVETGVGRRVFLAFQADWLLRVEGSQVREVRHYQDYRWQSVEDPGFAVVRGAERLRLDPPVVDGVDQVRTVQWFSAPAEGPLAPGKQRRQSFSPDQVFLPYFHAIDSSGALERRGRYGAPGTRPKIYQMLPRLFGNENERRKVNGSLRENGVGQFADLSESVLEKLGSDGFTHIWLTGVLQQATSTDYAAIGQPADDPDLLKGIAGSPYAIRDYFDVSPDYAEAPARRLEEFRALANRMDAAGIDLVIDFVPNHVARSYASDIRPDLSFGANDRKDRFFAPDNNFFYLTAEVADGEGPLRLPTVDPATGRVVSETARIVGRADGYFELERVHGKVTGNNVVSWRPSRGDWYETVKLNYGFNFLEPDRPPEYPSAISPRKPVPDTWEKMDAIIAYWQDFGVDGFRADMAHMVPPEFWKWLIHRARARDPDVFFFAEAYNDDPAKVPGHDPALEAGSNVMVYLLDAGFHAVYDDPGYDTLEHLFTQGAWANDLQDTEAALGPIFFDCALRYAENHDEVRLAHPETWGGHGLEVGRPVTGTLFGLSRGPVMLYHGQMVGEPALGAEGFGGDDQRTSIFDYWSMPVFNQWWNRGAADGGGLSPRQQDLRAWYGRLLELQSDPALTLGNTIFLNHANSGNPFFGKVEDVGAAGHWFFAYLRSDPVTDQHMLVTSNFHGSSELRHIRIRLPEQAVASLALKDRRDHWIRLEDRLNVPTSEPLTIRVSDALREGIYLPRQAPLSAAYWSLSIVESPPQDATQVPVPEIGSAFLGAPPLTPVRAGEALDIDLRRFGNPGKMGRYRVEAPDTVSVDLDRINHRLTVQPVSGTTGLHTVGLFIDFPDRDRPLSTRLPLAVEPVSRAVFELSGHKSVERVAVVGDFNDWNAVAHPLERTDTGWRLETILAPGTYRYKFVIDGDWLPDPDNEVREPDGYGGFNSLLELPGIRSGEEPPTLFVSGVSERRLDLQSTAPLARVRAEALPLGGGTIELPVVMDGTSITVETAGIPRGTFLRVLGESEDGRVGLPALAYAGGPQHDIWQDDIIYYAFTDRFHDGNPGNTRPVEDPDVLPPANYHGGDFQGILQKIEEGYFDALGVNVLWLAPLNQNPEGAWQEYLPPFRKYTGYHGYWPVERRGIEARFGGEVALRALVDRAQEAGMKVLADLVLKHVHTENPVHAERRELFGQLELSDGSRNLRRWNDNPFTTWFEPFLPAFDFRNPKAINYLLDDATYWLNAYQLDGYRLDAVKHIRPDFWWRFRSVIRDRFPESDFYFVGETFQNRRGIAAFVGPNMLDGQFDFPLYDVLIPCFALETTGFEALERALQASEFAYGRSVRMSPLLGNHDKSRFMAYADGDLPDPEEPDAEEVGWDRNLQVDNPAAYTKLKLAMTFLMTIDGVPMIYYGDEIGMTGAGDPDNRRMMRFGEAVRPEEASVKDHFSKLAHARRAHPALHLGSRRVLTQSEARYAYLRAHGDDRALVIFNRGAESALFPLDVGPEIESATLSDVLSGMEVEANLGKAIVRMPARSSAVFVVEDDAD